MRSGRGFLHIFYTWLVIASGFWLLFYYFSAVDLDRTMEYLIFILLGILSEWLAVSFPLGRLSGGFAIVLACLLIYGPETCAWIGALAALIAGGVANRGDPLRTTLFNTAQQVLAVLGSASLCSALPLAAFMAPAPEGANLITEAGVAAFVLFYFAINHILVYLYAYPGRPRQRSLPWLDALRWDGLTYLVTGPFGTILAMLYIRLGMATAVFLFVPVLVVQFIMRRYVNVELANRELRAMYEISKRLGGRLEHPEIPELLLKEARRAVPCYCGVVYMQSDNPDVYAAEAVYGLFAGQMKKSAVYSGEGFLGFVLDNKKPEIIYDSRADFRVRGEPGMPQIYRSMLLVPLVTGEGAAGLLALGEKRPMAYDEHHLQTLAVIVGALSVALTNNLLKKRIGCLEIIDIHTGMYNRSYFYRRCRDYFAAGSAGAGNMALIIADVDYMEQLNSRYGYLAGDRVLQNTAQIIIEHKPEEALASRFGSDEFALLLFGAGEEDAYNLAENIREAVVLQRFPEGLPARVSISCGVAVLPQGENSADKLFELCAKSLDRAKRTGRDRVVCSSQL
jgi:diguanylate cyclase (GGDEF)-like protein